MLGVVPALWVFARAGAANYFDSNGLLQSAATGVPRFDYDPATLQFRGLLHEQAKTNLLLDSGDAGAAATAWIKTAVTVLESEAGIDGVAGSADRFQQSTGAVVAQDLADTGATAAASTFSAYIMRKGGGADWLRLSFGTGSGGVVVNGGAAWFNTNTGALGSVASLGTGSVLASRSEVLPNAWFRLSVTIAATGAAAGTCGMISTSGNGSNTVLAGADWAFSGGQVETGNGPSSWIRTVAAPVARAVDTIRCLAPDLASFWNPVEGCMYSEVMRGPDWPDSGSSQIVYVNDGTSNNRVSTVVNVVTGALSHLATLATVSKNIAGTSAAPALEFEVARTACSYSSVDSRVKYYDGAAPDIGLACSPLPLTQASAMELFGGVPLNGWMRAFRYWDSAGVFDDI